LRKMGGKVFPLRGALGDNVLPTNLRGRETTEYTEYTEKRPGKNQSKNCGLSPRWRCWLISLFFFRSFFRVFRGFSIVPHRDDRASTLLKLPPVCGLVALLLFAPPPGPAAADEAPKQTLPEAWTKALHWRCIGPANMGGRITAISV